jgi:hypothetical protein
VRCETRTTPGSSCSWELSSRGSTSASARSIRKRLAALVGRLASRLPIAGFPSASAALAAACRAFERDKTVRRRLRAELLLDSLTTVVEALGAAA